MFGNTKFNFWLDVTIFTAFVVTAITGLLLWLMLPAGPGSSSVIFMGFTKRTWLDIHDWAGLAMLIAAGTHIALHAKWISCVAERYFKKLARQARVNFSLNTLLFVAFSLASLSGLVVWLLLPGGYQGGRNPYYSWTLYGLDHHQWGDVHLYAGLAMIAILTVHLALHWNWVMCFVRRYAQAAVCVRTVETQSNECKV